MRSLHCTWKGDAHSPSIACLGSKRTDAGDIVAGGAKRDLTPAQRAALKSGETAAKAPGVHAEITNLNKAKAMGAKPEALVATRPICANCAGAIEDSGGQLINSTTAVWPKK